MRMTPIETATMQVLSSRPRTALGLVVGELGKQGVSFEAPPPKIIKNVLKEFYLNTIPNNFKKDLKASLISELPRNDLGKTIIYSSDKKEFHPVNNDLGKWLDIKA
jgi:hypothetical protein